MSDTDLLRRAGLVEIGPVDAARAAGGQIIEFMPQDRYDNIGGHALNRHGAGPFCRLQLPPLHHTPGVYAIEIGARVVYVGECQDLAERFGPRGYGVIHPRNCFNGGQPTNCKINSRMLAALYEGATPVLWFAQEPDRDRKELERELIAAVKPPWNGRGQ